MSIVLPCLQRSALTVRAPLMTANPDRRRAQTLVDAGAYQQAKPVLALLLAENPEDEWLMCAMTRALIGLGDIPSALPLTERLVAAHPNSGQAQRLRALVAGRAKLHDPAYAAAQAAVRIEPHSWAAHHVLVVTALNKNLVRQAEHAAAESLRLAPNQPDAHYAVGLVAARRARWKKAGASYRQALAIDPDHALSLMQLAKLADNRTVVGRVHLLRQVLRLDPRSGAAALSVDRLLAGLFWPSVLESVMAMLVLLTLLVPGQDPLWYDVMAGTASFALLAAVVTPAIRLRGIDGTVRRLLVTKLVTRTPVQRSAIAAVVSIVVATLCLIYAIGRLPQ